MVKYKIKKKSENKKNMDSISKKNSIFATQFSKGMERWVSG